MNPFLKTAINAAQSASEIITHYTQKGFSVTYKTDSSPVTKADKEAESAIRQIISSAYPDHAFIGEEYGSDNPKAEFHWIIDPIDGTKNYVRGIPFYATQIALMQQNQLILGVSNAPDLNQLIYASIGQGAFFNHQPIHTSEIESLDQAYLGFGTLKYFENAGKLNQLLKLSNQAHASRGIGDFFSHTLVAQGKIDIMLEAMVKFWDIAALSVIITEAGGQVSDLDGNPITPQSTTFISSNSHLHQPVINILKSISSYK